MNVLSFTSIFLLLLNTIVDNNFSQETKNDGEVFFYEYAIKKPYEISIGFITINNNLIVQDIGFDVWFSKDGVKSISKKEKVFTNSIPYSIIKDGILLLKKTGVLCYDSARFIQRRKGVPDKYYLTLSPSFLEMTNQERFQLLNELSAGMTEPMTELLSSTESSFLNDIFKEEREGFDFFEKQIAFICINGEWGKEAYFKMHTLHAEYANTPYPYPCNKGTLYIFNATQKDECGGYDAAIIYWSKRRYSNEDVVLRIKKHRLRIKKHRRDCQGVVWGSDHPKE